MKPLSKIVEPYVKSLTEAKYPSKANFSPDLYLFSKWAYRVEKGWYGFSLGNEVPMVWAQIIDDFLRELEKEAPKFKIQQIKLKFGGLRFYVQLNSRNKKKCEEINHNISGLSSLLFNAQLIY